MYRIIDYNTCCYIQPAQNELIIKMFACLLKGSVFFVRLRNLSLCPPKRKINHALPHVASRRLF